MKSLIPPSLTLTLTLFLLSSSLMPAILAAPPLALLERPQNDLTDPYHQPATSGSSISLLLSGFLRPPSHFEPLQLLDIAAKAQAEMVAGVVSSRGDAVVLQPNFQWCSWHGRRVVCLRVNHSLDSALRWSELSRAVGAVVEFGWEANFVTVKRISVYEETRGVVANAELVFGL